MAATAEARAGRAWWRALPVALGMALLCAGFVDRPVAEYLYRKLYSTALFTWAQRLFPPLQALFAAWVLGALGAAAWGLSGKRLPAWSRVARLGALAAVGALAVAIGLKHLLGRSDVYPTYLIQGIYTLRPLHGGAGYSGFPSATMATASAVLSVFWVERPALRLLSLVALGVIVLALLVSNSHWVSDILGGGCLGGSLGVLVLRRSAVRLPRG
ncbi:MAG TPA: phosphatase PAP2 family protein [Gemmatimonadales bacterium]|nr:phosphatase PAP2 family protein [Gemmatimonadales bacterium]